MSEPKKRRVRKPIKIEVINEWLQVFKNEKRLLCTNKMNLKELEDLLAALHIPYETINIAAL